jgi:hypothetical protein
MVAIRKVGKPKGSPKTPGSGRKKGTPNKATSEVKSLSQRFGEEIIDQLHRIAMNKRSSDTDKIAAIKELLNRGYGKSVAQMNLAGHDGGPLSIDLLKSLPEDELMTFANRFITEVLDSPERRMRLAAEEAEHERLKSIFPPSKPDDGSGIYRPPNDAEKPPGG